MTCLCLLLNEGGETEQAEQLFRQAASLGSPEAMYNLGVLLEERGETEQAEQLYGQATGLGYPSDL